MATKECPVCKANGINMMNGDVTQLMNAATKEPMIIDWTCGYCGNKDQDIIHMGEMGGCQNEKVMILPAEEPEEPVLAVNPPKPEPVVEPEPAE